VQPGLHQSELFADLAEAFQHLQALELELRREDGSVVPTSDIGIQDTERLLELFPADDDDLSAPDSEGEDVLGDPTDRELQDDVEDMLEADIAERIRASPVEDLISDWTPDDFEAPHPRYQIHVLLLRDDAIP
jgi:hypothetical protein